MLALACSILTACENEDQNEDLFSDQIDTSGDDPEGSDPDSEAGSSEEESDSEEENTEEDEAAPVAIEVANGREDQSPYAQDMV